MLGDLLRGRRVAWALLVGVQGVSVGCGESAQRTTDASPAGAGDAGDHGAAAGAGAADPGAGGDGGGAAGIGGAGELPGAGAPAAEAGAGGSAPSQAGAPGHAGADGQGGAGGEPTGSCDDGDGDGFGLGSECDQLDCDDDDPLVNPGMLELADDAQDNDCLDGDLKAVDGPGYYVDTNDAACSDGSDAVGTKSKPYCTLAMAVLRAYQATPGTDSVGRSLFVAQGTYPLATGTPRSMRIYGGYDSSDWSYAPDENVTILGGGDVMKDLDDFAGYTSWLSVNLDANVVFQGFHVQGGKRPGLPIFAIELQTSGRVVLYDNVIVAGEGWQTLAVSIKGETQLDPSTSDAWLIDNRISAGTPSDSSNYAVNNLGTAVLWGNVIDMGQGVAGSFGAAVQNYGVMTLVGNLLNGGSYGQNVDSSYGFINATADALPAPGSAHAELNLIFGGAGKSYSTGVLNAANLTLVDNLLGDRTPGPLAFAQKPSVLASTLSTGFAAGTLLFENELFQLLYEDEPSPPSSSANRRLFVYSDSQSHEVDDVAVVNACGWTGCSPGTGLNSASAATGRALDPRD